jgi:serine/threonine protein kinase
VTCLISELVEGLSLDKVLAKRGKIPLAESLSVIRQILDAVGHAHSAGIIHRDIKPANIIVTADGKALITDFGVAKVVGGTHLTSAGTSMGSPDYMSPEQVL